MAVAERSPKVGRIEPINPKWVRFVLKDRGMPCPDLPALEAAIKAQGTDEREAFRGSVRRVQLGVESADDTNLLQALVTRAADGAAAPQVPDFDPPELIETPTEEVAAPAGAASPAPRPMTTVEMRKFERSHHVYAGKGAAAFEPVEVPSERPGQEGWHTIQIEMAKAISTRRYDWDHKIVFRLTLRELPVFAAVLLGHSPFLIAGNHGPGHDKFLEMRDQSDEGTIMIVLKQGKRVVGLPIAAEEVFALGSMAFKALQRNAPHLDSSAVTRLVERSGQMYGRAIGGMP